MGGLVVTILALVSCGLVWAEDAGVAATAVFTAGQGGYHTYRIPAVVVTTNGTVLLFCEGRRAGRADSGAIDLLEKRSLDGGKTWEAQRVVWSDADNTCGNPAPVVDRDTGIVWLLMTWNLGSEHEKDIEAGRSEKSRRVFVTHSSDDGKTWAAPEDITGAVKLPEWRWYATGPVNGIQILHGPHAGRLVIPCNHTASKSDEHGAASRSHVIYSDDHGATWHLGGIEDERTNESTVVELENGEIMQNMRSYREKKLRAVATSGDGGMTWSPARDDAKLIEPVCQGSLLRCTWPENGGRSRILFCNPASAKRDHLTMRVSYDEGRTWAISELVHAGPAGYSGMAMLPDGEIGCFFECGEKGSYETISMARIAVGSWEKKRD